MITTLRRNWLKILMIGLCAMSFYEYVFLQHKYFYPLYLGACWALLWWTTNRFFSRIENYELLQTCNDYILFLSLSAALTISRSFVRENYVVGLIFLAALTIAGLFDNPNWGTHWPFLIKLIIGTLIFIVCFFALIFFNSV